MAKKRLSKSQSGNRRRQNQPEFPDLDIAMLKENLKRTPAERIRRHQIALNTIKKLRKAEQI